MLLPVTISIGGDLPESLIPPFENSLMNILTHTNMNYKKEYIHNQIMSKDVSFEITADFPNGELESGLHIFCKNNDLTCKMFFPAHMDDSKTINNSVVLFWKPGMEDSIWIPVNEDEEPLTVLSDMFKILNNIFDEYEQPIESAPLKINESDIKAEIALRRLKQEPLRKILVDILQERLGYPNFNVPKLKIIKGI